VATDVRLYMRGQVKHVLALLGELIITMVKVAEEHLDLLMAGFTHLQPAQPVRFSHWVMSHAAALLRDWLVNSSAVTCIYRESSRATPPPCIAYPHMHS
jgi:argininosuccinate lyase